MPQLKHSGIDFFLSEQTKRVNECLDTLVAEQAVPYANLFSAARYSLLSGGKRIRPLLAIATCAMCNEDKKEAALMPAAALEMVHTYSLIHDDLPSMDNDDYRRGKPTLHKIFPEGIAILAGDYLLTQAFETLAAASGLTEAQRLKLIRVLGYHAGGNGMIAGQILDIESTNMEIDLEILQLMHHCKTGALLSASVEFGAIIADASEEITLILRAFSRDMGLAFQVVDDILDVTSSESKHGKNTSSDVTNGKTTYVTLLGLDNAKKTANKLLNSALNQLSILPYDSSILSELARLIINRSR